MDIDMKPFRFTYEENRIVTDVGWAEGICQHAQFIFDQPVLVKTKDALELDDGQLFLITFIDGVEQRTMISGRWHDRRLHG